MDMNQYENHFWPRLIAKGTWLISTITPEMPYSCDCFLLEGDEYALAIDSGMSQLNIAAFMQQYTDLPIVGVVNTHGHFDHILGNGFFKRAYMHKLVPDEKTFLDPSSVSMYPECKEIHFIGEGYTFNLGNRELEVIEIGAHALSSIALLDRTNRILFTGDELETGWINVGSVFEHLKGRTIETHYNNMQKLKRHYDEFDIICPSHHGAPIPKECLNHFLICDKMIMEGAPGSSDIPVKAVGEDRPDHLRVMRYKTAHLCYSIHTIFEK